MEETHLYEAFKELLKCCQDQSSIQPQMILKVGTLPRCCCICIFFNELKEGELKNDLQYLRQG